MIRDYFHQLESKIRKYSAKYSSHPRTAAARLALWNLKCSLARHITMPSPTTAPLALRDDVLRIAIAEGGGIGDACFQTTYIKEIRKMFSRPVVIDFYCRAYHAFDGFPFIDDCMPYPQDLPQSDYDVFIVSRRFYIVLKIDVDKTKRFSKRFYDFCMDCRHLTSEILNSEYNDNLYNQYCILLGKNRLEQADPHEMIPVTRNTAHYMAWRPDAVKCLDNFGLVPGEYITLNRGAGTPQPGRHPKLWPLENYNALVRRLKAAYPQYKIIQIGTADASNEISGTDMNLSGKTDIEQVKVLLKYSALHIDGEGGLVHIRKFLNGKSLVFFGPTRVDVFGYSDNINLCAGMCAGGCEWVTPHWYKGCMRGFDVAPCMRTITPDMAFDAAKKFLDEIKTPEYDRSRVSKWTPRPGDRIAVIGRCDAVKSMARLGAHVTVYDANLATANSSYVNNCGYLEIARRGGFTTEYATPYNIPAPDNMFDAVYITDLSQYEYPELVVRECMRILRPGGNLIDKSRNKKKFTCLTKK